MTFFRKFERNTAGRDFVVGDVHGCFDMLRKLLREANFNEATDRLFSVGDLVDRGPSSHEAVEYLDKPWFHAVRGNHEQMAIEADLGLADSGLHCINGGLWFYGLTDKQRNDAARAFAELPYAIEVEAKNGLIGLVHAEVAGDDWAFLRDALLAADAGNPPANFEHIERFVLWGRDVIRGRSDFSGVQNIDRVYVGHTPVKDWQVICNVHYIDTGAVFGRPLTLACISDESVLQEAA
jgi:serine/threonine protein phosphatase 1